MTALSGPSASSGIGATQFALLAAAMLATPLALFAIGCALDHVLLIDGSGALFGVDFVLVLWLRDQFCRTPDNQHHSHSAGNRSG